MLPITSKIYRTREEFIRFVIDSFMDMRRNVSGDVDVSVHNEMADVFII